MDFVHGRYIDNGNSNMPEKGEVFRKVNSLTDNQRWNISAGVKTFNIKFSGIEDSVFANAYTCLLNFSNTSRIRFCFDESLKASKSKYLKQLIVESGNEIFFYDFPRDRIFIHFICVYYNNHIFFIIVLSLIIYLNLYQREKIQILVKQ